MKIAATFALVLTCSFCWSLQARTRPHSSAAGKSSAGRKVIDLNPPDADSAPGLITTDLGGRELQFFQEAYALGLLQTWLGGQAKTRGEADRVKALGEAVQDTQNEETQLLLRLARKKGAPLVSSKAGSPEQKQLQAQLAPLQGAKFDAAVLDSIVSVSQRESEAFTRAAASSDPDIQRFVAQIGPIIKDKWTLASRVSGKPLPTGAKPSFRENAPTPPPAEAPAPATGEGSPQEKTAPSPAPSATPTTPPPRPEGPRPVRVISTSPASAPTSETH